MRALLWKFHPWIGVLSCLALLMWGLSGLSHPVMSRLQPKPVRFEPPLANVQLERAVPLPVVLRRNAIARIVQAGIAQWDGAVYYRLQLPAETSARYFSIRDGIEKPDADRLYAQALARHYISPDASRALAVRRVELLNEFDAAYPSVNKILPVWRVEFSRADRLAAYIDTSQARLVTLSDATRSHLASIFRWAHTWSFLEGWPRVRVLIQTLLLTCVLLSAISGLYFFFKLRPGASSRLRAQPLRLWHRRLAIVFSGMALTSGVSGAYHLLHGYAQDMERIEPVVLTFGTAELQGAGWYSLPHQPLAQLSLARLDGAAFWLAVPSASAGSRGPRAQVAQLASEADAHAEHRARSSEAAAASTEPVFVRADGGAGAAALSSPGTRLAAQLAARHAALGLDKIANIQIVTRFTDEYGFFFKRLPVYRVQFEAKDNPRYYVETASGALAARIDDRDALEGLSFAYLHKWNFFGNRKDLRDVLLMVFALGNVLVAVLGLAALLIRYIPRRRWARRPVEPRGRSMEALRVGGGDETGAA